jgi:hypothetical protein
MIQRLVVSLIFLALSGLQALEFDLSEHQLMSLAIPDGWSIVRACSLEATNEDPQGYAVKARPSNGAKATLILTVLMVKNEGLDKELLRKRVLDMINQMNVNSVEKNQELLQFSLKKGIGLYGLFTDASLVGKPVTRDEFRVMAVGHIILSKKVIGFVSLFADDKEGEEMQTMIKVVNSLGVGPRIRK